MVAVMDYRLLIAIRRSRLASRACTCSAAGARDARTVAALDRDFYDELVDAEGSRAGTRAWW